MLLRAPGIFPDSSLHVSYVEGDKLLKGHAQICHLLLHRSRVPTPVPPVSWESHGFSFFCRFPGPILVVKGYIPGSFLLILIRLASNSSLLLVLHPIDPLLKVAPAHLAGNGQKPLSLQLFV